MPIKDPIKRRENHTRYMRERYQCDPVHRFKQLARVACGKGRVKQEPCKCGSADTEKHHEDYNNPMDVVWVCRTCHLKLHAIE